MNSKYGGAGIIHHSVLRSVHGVRVEISSSKFELAEKVDCVVISYVLCTFLTNVETLQKMLERCKAQIKKDGCVFIADWSYNHIPNDNWFYGCYS